MRYRPWTEDDLNLLRSWPRESSTWIDDVCDSLDRTISSIISKCQKMKLPCPGGTSARYGYVDRRLPFWTEERLRRLKLCHDQGHSYIEKCQILKCSRKQLTIGHRKLGIYFHHKWSKEQLHAARTYHPSSGKTRLEVAREIGVPEIRFISMVASLRRKARISNAKNPSTTAPTGPKSRLSVPSFDVQWDEV